MKINENLQTQIELEKLCQAIYDYLTDKFYDEIKSHIDAGSYIMPAYFGTIYLSDVSYYNGPLNDFKNKLRLIFYELKPNKATGFYRSDKVILLGIDEWYIKFLNNNYKDKSSLRDFFAHTESVLMHELTHAYDDYKSNGKYHNNKRTLLVKSLNKDSEEYKQAYINDPIELNARFAEIISELRKKKFISWNVFKTEFESNFLGWDIISKKEKQRLLSRLYTHFHLHTNKKHQGMMNFIMDKMLKLGAETFIWSHDNKIEVDDYGTKNKKLINYLNDLLTKYCKKYNLELIIH